MGAMPKHLRLLLLALPLALPAHAEQWFALTSRDTPAGSTLAEVDLATVRLRGGSGEAVIRVSHEQPRTHAGGFQYRSFIATAQIDCQRQAVSLMSAAYFPLPAGQGMRLGADSAGRASGMPPRLLESIPLHARQALLRAACVGS
jgi:hypothetical protein